jgi:hypothetical protein
MRTPSRHPGRTLPVAGLLATAVLLTACADDSGPTGSSDRGSPVSSFTVATGGAVVTVTQLPLPDGARTGGAGAVDAEGWTVGTVSDGGFNQWPMLWGPDGTMVPLAVTSPLVSLREAFGMNAAGLIVGTAL